MKTLKSQIEMRTFSAFLAHADKTNILSKRGANPNSSQPSPTAI